MLRNVAAHNQGPLPIEHLECIYREIMSASRALERVVRVAYLGPAGTFSEAAVHAAFGHGVLPLPCLSLDEVFRAAQAGTADMGIVPIENNMAGSVGQTLDLLLTTPLTIAREIALPVLHNVMSASGSLDGVTRICAHAQALAQCVEWLGTHAPGVERLAVVSNAEAARMAQADPSCAALASEAAAARYGLRIVARHIQDDPDNTTRFIVVRHEPTEPSGARSNRSCLVGRQCPWRGVSRA